MIDLSAWMLSSSILILLVLALRSLLRRRISGRVQYALWALVLARLLLPLQLFSTPVSVEAVTPDLTPLLESVEFYGGRREVMDLPEEVLDTVRENAQTDTVIYRNQESRTVLGGTMDYFNGCQVLEAEGVVEYDFYANLEQVLLLLWGIGVILAAGVLTVSNLCFIRRLRRCRQALCVPSAALPVYITDGLPSPCLFGVFRPAVYLTPATAADAHTLRHVLVHEETHYRHRDHIWSLLRSAALALHWYNPLVWWAAVLSKQDGELACDESTLKRLGEGERAAYGRTLLALLTAKPRAADLLSCATTMTGGARNLRERITRIVNMPQMFLRTVLVVTAVAIAAAVLVFSRTSGPVWQEITVKDGIPYGRMDETEDWTRLSDTTIDPPRDWAALPGMGLAGRELETYLKMPANAYLSGRMVNGREGWLVASSGRGMGNADTYAYRTEDGGMTWREVSVPEEEHWYPSAVGFISGDRLIIAYQVFDDSPAYITKDGGETWERIILLDGTGLEVSDIAVSGDTVTMTLGTLGGVMLQSADQGDSWELASTSPRYDAEDFPIRADMDHDGADEEILLEDTYGDGSLWTLSVVRDGEVLWSETGSDAHAGWNTLVLLTIGGQDYLMRYQPVMYHGDASCSYQIFYLDGQGREVVYRENQIDFCIHFDTALHQNDFAFDPAAISSFVREVNAHLSAGTVLLNTNPDLTSEGQNFLYETLSWLTADGFTWNPSRSLQENLVDYQIQKEGKDALTAQELIATITAEDFWNWDSTNSFTQEELLGHLHRASTRAVASSIQAPAEEYGNQISKPLWTAVFVLNTGKNYYEDEEGRISIDASRALTLSAGLTENLVEVTYDYNPYHDTVVVADDGLYWMLRTMYDREESVDQEAFSQFGAELEHHMEEQFSRYRSGESGDFPYELAGYEATNFQMTGTYDDIIPGVTVVVYDFDYAIIPEDPRSYTFLDGGSYLDSQLRIRGFDRESQCFVALYRNGVLEETQFRSGVWEVIAEAAEADVFPAE